ncbi:MAG: hypothetical protein KAJ10_05235 [Thermodesulfovibrionia bacterium]|nr:hypothetical protein [Thermodesulfovibrionia bacterium]
MGDTVKHNYSKIYVSFADLDDYPWFHEVLGFEFLIEERMEEGHGVGINYKYFDMETDHMFFENTKWVPEPSEEGYTHWNWYRFRSWVGKVPWEVKQPMEIRVEIIFYRNNVPAETYTKFLHVLGTPPPPEVICTPGTTKCIGNDLHVCNAAGTAWDLLEANAQICQVSGGCPDFWTDPIGAVMCWILTGFDALLGVVQGGFATLILNTQNFLNNFGLQLSTFINDVKGGIESAVGGIVATMESVANSITTGLSDWWEATKDTVISWMDTLWTNATDFWSAVAEEIGRWWDDTWSNMTDFWNDFTKGINDWWDDTKKAVWDGLVSFKNDLSDLITDKFTDFIGFISGLTTDFVTYLVGFVAGAILGTLDTLFQGIQTGAEKEQNKRKGNNGNS